MQISRSARTLFTNSSPNETAKFRNRTFWLQTTVIWWRRRIFITFTAIELQNVQWAMSIIRMWAVKWPSMQLKIFISRILGWPYSNILRNHYTWIASNFSENSLNWMRLTCICVCACVWIMNWKQSGGTCLPITPLNYTVCTHIRFELPARFTNRTITMLYHFAVHTLFCAA